MDIFIAALDGAWTRKVSRGDEYVLEPKWSPDGTRLLWCQWPHYDMPWDELAVVVADAEGNGARVVAGGSRVTNNYPVWSPDGQRIAFISDREGDFGNLWVMNADGSGAERLVRESHQHASPAWSPDGRRIAYTRNDDGDVQVCIWENGQTRQLTSSPGVHDNVAWLDADHLVYAFSSPVLPADVYVHAADGSTRRPLTQSATGGVLGGDLIMPEHVQWTSRDGLEISGLLITPRGDRARRPSARRLDPRRAGRADDVQLACRRCSTWRSAAGSSCSRTTGAARGMAAPSWRNCTATGAAATSTITSPARRWSSGRGWRTRARSSRWAARAGGYSTLICMTKAPDFFRAGVCRYGIADLATFTDKTWIFERHYIAKLMGAPSRNSALYVDRSAIHFVQRCQRTAPDPARRGGHRLPPEPDEHDGGGAPQGGQGCRVLTPTPARATAGAKSPPSSTTPTAPTTSSSARC